MATVTVSDKGQITLPTEVRRKLGLKPKSCVDVKVRGSEIVVRPVRSVRELSGVLREHAKGKTTDRDAIREETMRAVAEEAADADRR